MTHYSVYMKTYSELFKALLDNKTIVGRDDVKFTINDTEIMDKLFPFPPSFDVVSSSVNDTKKELPKYYPKAILVKSGGVSRGKYAYKWPQGAIVHWTSGWNTPGKGADTLKYCFKMGYGVQFAIDWDGTVYQAEELPLSDWGYHAGRSEWIGLKGSVSDELTGIELCCGGLLNKFYYKDINGVKTKIYYPKGSLGTEFGKIVPIENQRTLVKKRYPQETLGTYEIYSEAQERELILLLKWLREMNSIVFETKFILGHDEVAPDRKCDPSGSLSMGMPKLRELIDA